MMYIMHICILLILLGVTIAANFYYCDSIAIGENTIVIVLLGNQIKKI